MRKSLFSQNRHMTTSDSSSRILDVDRFEKVRRELMSRLGVTSKPHRFGGTEFQVKAEKWVICMAEDLQTFLSR